MYIMYKYIITKQKQKRKRIKRHTMRVCFFDLIINQYVVYLHLILTDNVIINRFRVNRVG
jgi:hypothetical protein